MSYFTDDSPHKSTSEPLIVDNNNLPEPELGLWDQNVQRFIKANNSDIATAKSQNITEKLTERSQVLEEELGPNYIEKLKEFGYDPGFYGPKGKDPWLSTGREETFETAIKKLRNILPAEARSKLYAGDELELAASETAKRVDVETSKKLQNTKYGWWAGIFGDIGAHLTDPLEMATLGFFPNMLAGRIIAQGGKTSLASRAGVYAGTEAGVAAAFETPNQFLNVKDYKNELGIKYTNSDAAQAVFAATILSAVGAGAFEVGAGGLRKLKTGEWGISEYNSHVAKHYDQMSPEMKHAHELVDQATEHGRLNPFGDTPEGVQRHIDETMKAERFVDQDVRDVPQGDIEAAQDLAKQIETQSNELPDVQKLREEFLEEHQLAQAPKPESDIPEGFAFLNDVANDILPDDVRVQVVDEIARVSGGKLQEPSIKTDTPEFKHWSDNAPLVKSNEALTHDFKTGEKVVVEGFHGTSLDTGEHLAYITGQEIIPRPVNGIDEFKTKANPVDLRSTPRSMGTFFSSNPELASQYSKVGTYNYNNSQVYPVYIAMKKPLVVDAKGRAFDDIPLDVEIEPGVKLRTVVDDDGGIYGLLDKTNTNAVTQYARHAGYDGVVFKNIIDNASVDLAQSTNFASFEPSSIKSINNRGSFDPNDPRILYQSGPNDAQGSFNPAENLIQIARSAVNPTGTLRHEAIHALKNLNLFKKEEWNLLETTAREMDWIKKHNIESRYSGEFKGDDAAKHQKMTEEAIAEEFSQWRRGELQVTQEIKTIFERIQAMLGQVTEMLQRAGIKNYEDVFKRIESGDIKNRAMPELRDDVTYEIGVGTKGETVTPKQLIERADYELQQAEAISLCLKVA